MASKQGSSQSTGPEWSYGSFHEPLPGIAALFLIRFDLRAGYTVAWNRSIANVELDGVVEFKSLPSGLHNISEDLVYFTHGQYAGISAFINEPAAESERNATMIAVGVLVPRSYGRLGKSWKHADALKQLARKLAQDIEDTHALAEYWESHQISEDGSSDTVESPLESPSSPAPQPIDHDSSLNRPQRTRALSDATALVTRKQALTPHHPARSLPTFVHEFGPLIFPLYRAALLRKRVLFVGHAPVELACNYVYDLSILSSIPHSVLPFLPSDDLPPLRPRPLFSVGIHDIPYLSSFNAPPSDTVDLDPSWIACTTDEILTMKSQLYDILVTLPPEYSKQATQKVYPSITLSSPVSPPPKKEAAVRIKATQRDARRYVTLREGLQQFSKDDNMPHSELSDYESDTTSTFSSKSIVEPLPWPLLAYTSFIWWASAGEKRLPPSEDEEEECEQDARLLTTDSGDDDDQDLTEPSRRQSLVFEDQSHQPEEVALVAYFQRLTTRIFTVLADAIARQDDDGAGLDLGAEEEDPRRDGDIQGEDGDRDNGPDGDHTAPDHAVEDVSAPLLESTFDPRDEDDAEPEPVTITTDDMTQMGLDIWSGTDRAFAEELVAVWWGRKAQVRGGKVKCCGISLL